MNLEIINDTEISKLYDDIKELVEQNRNRVYKTVNVEMIICVGIWKDNFK